MADIIRNAIIRLAIEQGETKLNAPDMSKLFADMQREIELQKKIAEEAGKTAAAREEALQETVDELQGAIDAEKALQDEIKKTADEIKAAADNFRDASAQMIGGISQVGQGLLVLTRSAVLFGVSSEESMARVVEKLAKIQAVFDLFKGTTQIIQGIVDVQKAWAIATEILTAAKIKGTVATLAQAKANGILAASFVRLQLAMGSVGVILLAIAAAGVAVVALYKFFIDDSESLADAKRREADAIEHLEQVISRQHQAEVDAIRRKNALLAKTQGLGGEASELAKLREGEADRLEKLKRLEEQQRQVASAIGDQAFIQDKLRRQLEAIGAIREGLIQRTEKQAQLEERASATEVRRLNNLKREIDLRERALKTSKDALKAEQDKNKSLAAQFGALSKIDQADIKRLAAKAADGSLTLADSRRATGRHGAFLREEGEAVQRAAAAAAGFGNIPLARTRANNAREATLGQDHALAAAGLSKATGAAAADGGPDGLDSAIKADGSRFKVFMDKNMVLLEAIIGKQEQLHTNVEDIKTGLVEAS